MLEGHCHCGAVRVTVPHPPENVTECRCSICIRHGGLWTYYPRDDVKLAGATTTYAWGPKRIAYHLCGVCGCVMAWRAFNERYPECGVNARMLDGFHPDRVKRIVEEDASE